jgi:vacuolar protein sorting-associated protein VTA1
MAIKLATTKQSKLILIKIMDELEEKKKCFSVSENEVITNDVVGYAHVENFALKIFFNADNEDRAGKSSKKTAKTFLAASLFLELLNVFVEEGNNCYLDASIQEKIRYARWKAAEIAKAIKEGRPITPGPPTTEQTEDEQPMGDKNNNVVDDNFLPQVPKMIIDSPPTRDNCFSPSTGKPIISQTAKSVEYSSKGPDPLVLAKAEKNCKFAISALQYEDIPTAIDNLQKALDILNTLQK